MPTSYLDYVQPKSRIAIWAWSPVIVLRVALVTIYILYIYASVIAFVAGVPILDLTTPQGYTAVWAVALGAASVVSAIGSISDRWQKVEKWASLALTALLLTYIIPLNLEGFLENDLGRQFVGVVALIAGVVPIVRFVYLAAQSGKRKVDAVIPPHPTDAVLDEISKKRVATDADANRDI